jgi:hypothetical protein
MDDHRIQPKDIVRFNRKWTLDQPSGCHLWIRGNRNGYGVFFFRGRMDYAHRVSWIISKGEIPAGLRVLHKCDVPLCVNSEHLFTGTQADNIDDMTRKDRHGRKKLSREQVAEMRRMRGEHRTKQTDLAKMFGCSVAQVANILNMRQRIK